MQAFIFGLMKSRLFFLLGMLASTLAGVSQNTSTSLQWEQLNGPTPMQWITQRFLLHQSTGQLDLSMGLETQSAVLGDYGGFYVFGLHARASRKNKYFTSWAGCSLATGGGAGAPDGDGLMYRFQGQVDIPINSNSTLGLGYNYIDFPSGAITSNHFSFGLQYTMPYQWEVNSHVELYSGSISVLTGCLLFDNEDVGRSMENGVSFYNGVRFSQGITETLDLDLQLGASAIGVTDGFMDYKAGITFVPFQGKVRPLIRGQIGSGGGGAVHTGGGLSSFFGAGIRLFEHIELSASYWDALLTEMEAPFIELAFRFPFESNLGFIHSKAKRKFDTIDLTSQELTLIIGNRTNLAQGQDRNGLDYKPMSSIFLGAKLPVVKNIYFSGETLWAATGGYGAYAEGMFGLYYDAARFSKYKIGINSSVVAAGGGGIDVGRGTALAIGAHLQTTARNVPISFILRYKYFGQNAYNPIVIGVQIEPIFKVFKR
ncbi:MAG: hypothetical protein CMP53_04400 [Flavobacteriales bacterium]|nr:hypothetical protein [Flavobacteriales bacterium]|tara:strand:- start:2957 stop:4411 length:1455 start_codon:yes stop_codon:yes gene_type:complete